MAGNKSCEMKRYLGLVIAACLLAVGACGGESKDVNPSEDAGATATALPSMPSELPSGLPDLDAATAEFCVHLDDLTALLEDLQSSSSDLVEEATGRLTDLSSELQADATQLRGSNQEELANLAQIAALAIGGVQSILQQNPEISDDVRAAIGQVDAAIDAIPEDLCAGGSG